MDESDWVKSTLSTGNTRGATKSVEGMSKLSILDGVDLTPSAGKSMGIGPHLTEHITVSNDPSSILRCS